MKLLALNIPIPDGTLPAALVLVRSFQALLKPMASPTMQPDPGANALAANAILELSQAETQILDAIKSTSASPSAALATISA